MSFTNNKPDPAWNLLKHLKVSGTVSKEIYCELCFAEGTLTTSSLTILKTHLNNKHDFDLKNTQNYDDRSDDVSKAFI